ncbi:electron transfer flavoprotein subunit beta/FixA family protein [Kyrpidia spormannii]|uniref:Electron transfer flavoprotein subunit beta n=1 Tax=Kyrpidia spormannii TaxID=2055160 RepID=A0A6F9EF48_9BACL|nr:electron transfer flavoprotein subunit beta [Kyrpidia spormannii]CAB3395033.1 Electron transfer flavoprotein subunit beta [Kyrpidia spormannii]
MKMLVPMKLVPDVVEELVVSDSGDSLDREAVALKLNEWDEQALEQALLIKEAAGGEVIAVAAETGDVDDALYTALAKGGDRAIKLVGDGLEQGLSNRQYAEILRNVVSATTPDLILTGVQANDDLDGQLATWLAGLLEYPFVTVVAEVEAKDTQVLVKKEFSGGITASLTVRPPAVLGIQVSPTPPRYAPISRVRQMMKTATLEEMEVEVPEVPGIRVTKMAVPVSEGHAEMIEGDLDEKAARILALLKERGVIA